MRYKTQNKSQLHSYTLAMNNLKMKLSSSYNSIKRSKIVQNIFSKNYKTFSKKIKEHLNR